MLAHFDPKPEAVMSLVEKWLIPLLLIAIIAGALLSALLAHARLPFVTMLVAAVTRLV